MIFIESITITILFFSMSSSSGFTQHYGMVLSEFLPEKTDTKVIKRSG